MKKMLICAGGLSALLVCSGIARAEPGERWEITTKMDMEGMPFAMPAQTREVCIPKGKQGDPNYTQNKDSNCKMTDVKQSGNTVKFKGSCVQDGKTMQMSGETTHSGSSFSSSMKMNGESSGGRSMNMAMSSSGKKLGGSCDTAEQDREVKRMAAQAQAGRAQMDANMQSMKAQLCDVAHNDVKNLMLNRMQFLEKGGMCTDKKALFCKAVAAGSAKNPDDFTALQRDAESSRAAGSTPIFKACNLNMDNQKKNLCRANKNRGPLEFLDSNCPVEAKAYRELMRKREECAGRAYTGPTYAEDVKKCMAGLAIEPPAAEGEGAAAAGKSSESSSAESSASSEASSEALKQGTKTLKGLFGF